MKHILPTDTINKILNYLAGKSYSEVSLLIEEIRKSAVQCSEPKCSESCSSEEVTEVK
jgi:hypothetical protein